MHESYDFDSNKNPNDSSVENPILLVDWRNDLVGENPMEIGEASDNRQLALDDKEFEQKSARLVKFPNLESTLVSDFHLK